jgi:UDP:flavonoid glycosyltransferase YjiC (YdhE family)
MATAITARKLGLRWVTLTVFPGFIPSAYTVPQPHWLPALPTFAGRAVNRLTWQIYGFGLRHLAGDSIDEALRAHGLERDPKLFAPGGVSPFLTLVLSSPLYSPRLPDWPSSVEVAGYAEWDQPRGWQDPPQLEGFLQAGDAPVLVTTSTAGERDAVAFFRTASAVLTSMMRRGILLVGNAAEALGVAPGDVVMESVIAYPYLPFSRIVPRASLVVHHAGIVTALTTLRYGRACVAIPATFDQWYNAGRIRTLGVGRVLEAKRATAERLATEIESAASGAYGERARHIGIAMAGEDGAARACEAIEALLVVPSK